MKKRNIPREIVWEDKTKLVKVVWDSEFNQLFLTVGQRWHDTLFYFEVNLNGFWVSICEFMREREKEGKV